MRLNLFAGYLLVALIICAFLGSTAIAIKKKPESTDTPDTVGMVDTENIIESLAVAWPPEDKWYSESVHYGESTEMELFYPKGQSSDGWQEMATIEIVHGQPRKANLPGTARMTYLGTRRGCPNATWDILKQGENERDQRFIIYEIICPEFTSGEPPQIQYWKLIAGKTNLFNLQYSYRGTEIPAKRRVQILDVLDQAYIKVEKKETP